jgi:hypothetical protein
MFKKLFKSKPKPAELPGAKPPAAAVVVEAKSSAAPDSGAAPASLSMEETHKAFAALLTPLLNRHLAEIVYQYAVQLDLLDHKNCAPGLTISA